MAEGFHSPVLAGSDATRNKAKDRMQYDKYVKLETEDLVVCSWLIL